MADLISFSFGFTNEFRRSEADLVRVEPKQDLAATVVVCNGDLRHWAKYGSGRRIYYG